MGERTQADHRIGTWAATSVAAIAVVYDIVGLMGVVARPSSPNPLSQVDPYLAVMETLMILSTVGLVTMVAAVCACAPRDRMTFALTALAFIIVFTVLTSSVHFASLTVMRQGDPLVLPLLSRQLSFEPRPTLAMSLDLLAWDFFLGLSLVFAALVFSGGGLARRVRVSTIVTGTLCIVGTLGPATGHLGIQYVGIAGYTLALPVTCALLAMLFRRGEFS